MDRVKVGPFSSEKLGCDLGRLGFLFESCEMRTGFGCGFGSGSVCD